MKPGQCVHYSGDFHEARCEAGVNMRELVGGEQRGWVTRLPCTSMPARPDGAVKATCDKYQEPTEEQVREFEEYMERATQRMLRTLPLLGRIKTEHRGEDWEGIVECPECGGDLSLKHAAYNGHVWGLCSTKDCLHFME